MPETFRRWAAAKLLLASIATVVPLAGCGGSSSTQSSSGTTTSGASFYTGPSPSGTPKPGGSLTFETQGNLTTLDPALNSNTNQYASELPIFDQLVEDGPTAKAPEPALASSWSISPSGTTYTFHVRPRVRFSNGMPLTAADVAYSLNRVMAFTKKGLTGVSPATTPIQSVTARGPMAVAVQLTRPAPAFLDNLTAPFFSIVPEQVVQKVGDKAFGQHPVGTGPFTLTSLTPGVSEQLIRNPAYWRKGEPYLSKLTISQTTAATQRVLAVRAGQAQVADYVPAPQISSLRATPGARLLIQPYWAEDAIFLNTKRPPLNNTNVRLALMYALPVSSIIKTAYSGAAVPANTWLPQLQYWNGSVPLHKYNLTLARHYLAQSSSPHGFSVTFTIVGGDPQSLQVAQIAQSAWAQLGVRVAIHQEDIGTMGTDAGEGKLSMLWFPSGSLSSFTWAPDALADIAYDYPVNSQGLSFYNSNEETSLVKAAETTQSDAMRTTDFARLEMLSYQYAQFMPVAFPASLTLVSESVRGYNTTPAGLVYWQGVWLNH